MSGPVKNIGTPPASLTTAPFQGELVLEKIFPEGPAKSWTASYEALAQENQANLFHRDLLGLAQELEDLNQAGAALKIYSFLSEKFPETELGRQAHSQSTGILGNGALGSRLEFHSKRFLPAATDWKMIVPMIAASSVYRLGGQAVWNTLTRSSAKAWWSQGLGARGLSSGAGFLAETTVFSLGSRGLHSAVGEAMPWDIKSVGQDWLAASLTLGLLKGSGGLGRLGVNRYLLAKSGSSLSAMDRALMSLMGHGSGYLGLVGAHELESHLGWVEPSASPWLDGMSSYLSLSLGAKLGYGILGKRFSHWQQHLEQEAMPPVRIKGTGPAQWAGAVLPGAPMMLAMGWLSWAMRGRAWMQRTLTQWESGPLTGREVQQNLPAWEWDRWVSHTQSRIIFDRIDELRGRRGELLPTPHRRMVKVMKSMAHAQNIPFEVSVWRDFKEAESKEAEAWLDRVFPWHEIGDHGSHGYESQIHFIAATRWRGGTRRILDLYNGPEWLDPQKTHLTQVISDLDLTEAIPDLRKTFFDFQENPRVRLAAAEALLKLGDETVVRAGLKLLQRQHVPGNDYLFHSQVSVLELLVGEGASAGREILVPLLEDILTLHPTFRMVRNHPQVLETLFSDSGSPADLTTRRIIEVLFDKFHVLEGVIPRHVEIGEFLIDHGWSKRIDQEISQQWQEGPPYQKLRNNLASLSLWARSGAGERARVPLELMLARPEYIQKIAEYPLELAQIYEHLGAAEEARGWARRGTHSESWEKSVLSFQLLDRLFAKQEVPIEPAIKAPIPLQTPETPAVQRDLSFALGKINLAKQRLMLLSGKSYAWGERKFGRWQVQGITFRGDREILQLHRIQSGEEKGWPQYLEFEIADLEHPFQPGQEVWFLPANLASGGIDLIKNPAAIYAERNRGAKFSEDNAHGQFWLMPFVNEEILALLPGAKVHHKLVSQEPVDPPEWDNPLIKISTRGADPIWKQGDALYQFTIPYYFGEQLGLFAKKRSMEPWAVAENFHKKLVLIPDMLPKEVGTLATANHYHEANQKFDPAPGEVDSDFWRLVNKDNLPITQDSAEPLQDQLHFMVLHEAGAHELRPQVYWIYPKDQLFQNESKFVYPATVRQVDRVENHEGPLMEALIQFPLQDRRPATMPWIRFLFSDPKEFPFRSGEDIYLVKGAQGGSGMGEAYQGVYEREAIFKGKRGKHFQLLGVQIHKGRGVYFPTAPVERMEWRDVSILPWKKAGVPPSNSGQINLLLWTRDFSGKRKFYQLQAHPETLQELGFELQSDHKVAMPEHWAFMVRSLRELREQYREDLSDLLKRYRNGDSYLEKEIRATVNKLREWDQVEGQDSTWLQQLLRESHFLISFERRVSTAPESPEFRAAPPTKQVAWIGATQNKDPVTLVLADSPEAPASAPTWEVVRVMSDKVILGRKASNPGERPKGFLHVQFSKSDQKQFAPGQRYKVIHHVQGAAGRPPLPANQPGKLYLQGNDGVDYHLMVRKINDGVAGQEFLIFQGVEDLKRNRHDAFRASGAAFRVTFARGSLGELARQKMAGQFLQTISFDLTEAEAQMMDVKNLAHLQYVMEPYRPPVAPATKPLPSVPEKPTERITLVEIDDPDVSKTFNAHGSLSRHGDDGILWKMNPHRPMNNIGRGSALVDELGVEGYLLLTRGKGISLQHAQAFHLGSGRFSIRNTSSRGVTVLRPKQEELKLNRYGEEIELYPRDRLKIGSLVIDLEFPQSVPREAPKSSLERRSIRGEMKVTASSPEPSIYTQPVPSEILLFPEAKPEQNIIYLGRVQDTTGTGHYPVINIADPVVSLNHLEIKRHEQGSLQVTPLELGGSGKMAQDSYGTWTKSLGVWRRQAVGKPFMLYPGQQLALGTITFSETEGRPRQTVANLATALIFELGPQGRVLKRVND